jgi:hypothetical protein
MATNNSGKIPTPGHVIYDSRNDTSTGKKRAGTNKDKIKSHRDISF